MPVPVSCRCHPFLHWNARHVKLEDCDLRLDALRVRKCKEEEPWNMPAPRGDAARTVAFEDANLMHDLTTGRSATGILHTVNQTPIDWMSKRQSTVETATCGSEFNAGRSAAEQIISLRCTLRMMGVPIEGPAWMFGDNKSVVASSTAPHSQLTKRHNCLSFHRVREAIAMSVLNFLWIDGKENPADCMTKFLAHPLIKKHVWPLLFWKGETDDSVSSGAQGSDKCEAPDESHKTGHGSFVIGVDT